MEIVYKSLSKMVNKANRRLKRLQNLTGREVSWSGFNLQSKLDNEKTNAWSKDNLIQISETMSDSQLYRIKNATEEFLESRTSLITGVKKATKKTIREIGVDLDVDESEAEFLYSMFEDDEYMKYLGKSDKASEVWALIESAREMRMNQKTFIDRLYEISQLEEDNDITRNAKKIYRKYVTRRK